MGKLIEGAWVSDSTNAKKTSGQFERTETSFRSWITRNGSAGSSGTGGFAAQSGRYHLYVSYACPWAHRTLIFRQIKGLADHVAISVLHPEMLQDGWTFSSDFPGATGDRLLGCGFLREIYVNASPIYSGRVTVPVLWDSKLHTIVSNESAEIIRMFGSAFDGVTGNTEDYWPEDLRAEIEMVNERVYATVNNGVYRAGFAKTQAAYDDAVRALIDSLDWLEDLLSNQRYLVGGRLTEADWRLFTTLVRFDAVYHLLFKCNRRRLVDYPHLWDYARDLYQRPGIAKTVRFDHILQHYYRSLTSINPSRIIPINPVIDWTEPHSRSALPSA